MSDTDTPNPHSKDLEQALRVFETRLAEIAPDGQRHASPDADDERLHELRSIVIRRAEALPSAVWPRAKCEHCTGQREVEALQARYTDGAAAPQFDSRPRTCPKCWGTGLTLNCSG